VPVGRRISSEGRRASSHGRVFSDPVVARADRRDESLGEDSPQILDAPIGASALRLQLGSCAAVKPTHASCSSARRRAISSVVTRAAIRPFAVDGSTARRRAGHRV
jgi:hypothetical protein